MIDHIVTQHRLWFCCRGGIRLASMLEFSHMNTSNKKQIKKVISLFNKGLSTREIAEIFECTYQNISLKLIKYYGEGYQEKVTLNREARKKEHPKRECKECGVVFKTYYNKFCSRKCSSDNVTKYYRRVEGESEREFQKNRKRAYYAKKPEVREQVKINNRKTYLKDKTKALARANFHYHLAKGNVIKQDFCTVCKKTVPEVTRIEAHHEDYTKPLDVIWLCSPCHYKADCKLGQYRFARKGIV